MKAFASGLALFLCVIAGAAQTVLPSDEPAESTNKSVLLAWQKDFDATHEQRMQWWREARFGMFIHWGLYALPAGAWKGRQLTNHGGEWILHDFKIPVAEYAALTNQFNPVKFNATDWVKIAKTAGMKYIVITAKHHDGFAMYHSSVSPFNIYDATPFKRDPLKELEVACDKAGIKLGFYYSEAQDWSHPGGASRGGHWDPEQDTTGMDDYIDQVSLPQVKELLSNYKPAILWWDTPYGMTPGRAKKFLPLLKLQPELITNNRLDEQKLSGDYETPEQKIPNRGLAGDWETCMTMNGTWGYKSFDNNWKSTAVLIGNLVDIASKGGNYLLNVGPTAEGLIPDPSVKRLEEIGAWMKVNGQSIYGTRRLPENESASCPATASGTTRFLFALPEPKNQKVKTGDPLVQVTDSVLTLQNVRAPKAVRLLADGSALNFQYANGTVSVRLPVTKRSKLVDVVEVELPE